MRSVRPESPCAPVRRLGLELELLEPRILLSGTPEEQALELFSISPALFVENQGQWADESVYYVHNGLGASVAMTETGPVFQVFQTVQADEAEGAGLPLADGPGGLGAGVAETRMLQFSASFVGANTVVPVGLRPSDTVFNYLIGDQANWRENVASYEVVAYEGLYEGIDLLTWGQRDSLKYEFHVAPGADYARVLVRYEGIAGLSLAADGSLVVHLAEGWGTLVDDAPYIYQVIDGERVEVTGAFVLLNAATYGFAITGSYDPAQELVIDPDLAWSTYMGGGGEDRGYGIAVDGSGGVYVTGYTYSAGWASGGFDTSYDGNADAFAVKLTSSGSHAWSTYLGGGSEDVGYAIAVDDAGGVYVTGITNSAGWASGGFDETNNGSQDAFVAKLTASGTHAWSTYLGGSGWDGGFGIAVDGSDGIYVTGLTGSAGWVSGGFDVTPNGAQDAFVAKLTASGAHVWSTYLGGVNWDEGRGIAVDGFGGVYVTGRTASAGWTSGGFDESLNGADDAFVMTLTSSGSHAWSTYLGGSDYDYGLGIAADGSDGIYVTGYTDPAGWTSGGFDTSYNGSEDAFVAKVTASGAHVWSTYLGGVDWDEGHGIAVDGSDGIYVTGASQDGGIDAFVVKLTDSGSHAWSTYLGGSSGGDQGNSIAVDGSGSVLVTGQTGSSGWVSGGFDTSYGGGLYDAFVAKITDGGGGNTAPVLDLAGPLANVAVMQGDVVTITWTDSDPDDNASIWLAYDPDDGVAPWSDADHVWITQGLLEDSDGSGDQYLWDTTGVPAGTYTVWGVIDDGTNPPVYSRAAGRVTVELSPEDQTIFEAINFDSGVGAEIRTFITGLLGEPGNGGLWDTFVSALDDRFEFATNMTAGFKFGLEGSLTYGEGIYVDVASVGWGMSVAYNFSDDYWTISRGWELGFLNASLAGDEYLMLPGTADGRPITAGLGLTGEVMIPNASDEIKVGIRAGIEATAELEGGLGVNGSLSVETDLSEEEFLDLTGQASLGMAVLDSFGLVTSGWWEWTTDLLGRLTPCGRPILSFLGASDDPLGLVVQGDGDIGVALEVGTSASLTLKVNLGLATPTPVWQLGGGLYRAVFASADLGVATVWEHTFARTELSGGDDVGDTPATATQLSAWTSYGFSLDSTDRDVFAFDSPGGQSHEFVVTAGSAREFAVVIRDEHQDVLRRVTASGSSSSIIVPFTAEDAGQYYLSLEGTKNTSSGAYSLSWEPVRSGGTFVGGLVGYETAGAVCLMDRGNGDYAAHLEEHSPASMSTGLAVPAVNPELTFDYRLVSPGDGDTMEVRVNGATIWSMPIDSTQTDFLNAGPIGLADYAGQTVALEFYLNSTGDPNAAFEVDNVLVEGAETYTYYSLGSSLVKLYDTSGNGLNGVEDDIQVKFGSKGDVQVQLAGTQSMEGLGIAVTGATEVKGIKDGRKGTLGDLAFIASDAPIKSVQIRGGMSGYDLNGLTLGGLTFDDDIDGDGETDDVTAIYSTGASGSIKADGTVSGDIWIGGADARGVALGSYSSKYGGYHGDLTANGNVGKFSLGGTFGSSLNVLGSLSSFQLKGGDFLGELNVTGGLGKFEVTAGKTSGGWFRAGANVHVGGLLKSVKTSFCETDNGDGEFGIFAGSFGRLTIGAWKLDPLALPFQQDDFCVEYV